MKNYNLHMQNHWWREVCLVILMMLSSIVLSGVETIVIDSAHYSEVLGERRHFRIFLPSNYYDDTQRNYPVVYFYHGWSQRYFGSLNRGHTDRSQPSEKELISRMVDQYDIIVVKPDGYNANPEDPYYLRPYNISPVETYRQFPMYFPELVEFIDQNFRTIANRNQRGITGYSMGGFMSFWLAGKYPHLVSASGSFCGSPEFFVGPKDFPVEYSHADIYGNYHGVRLRLNYGEEDFIRAYHRDLNAVFSQTLDHFELGVYPGGHALSGLDDMFGFFHRAFQEPIPLPELWNHVDVYPDFEVWGYQVTSDRDIPGFSILENVSRHGFRSAIRPFLPEGRPMGQFNLRIRTAPIYVENIEYQVNLYDHSSEKLSKTILQSDGEGRLEIALNGGMWEVFVVDSEKESPWPVVQTMELVSDDWAVSGQNGSIRFDVLNMGNLELDDARLRVRLWKEHGGQWIEKSMENIQIGARTSTIVSMDLPENDELSSVCRIDVEIVDGHGQIWKSSDFLPVLNEKKLDLPFEIADGRSLTWISQARDTVTSVLGVGNGDGIANPGETIIIVVRDGEIYRLGHFFTNHTHFNFTEPGSQRSDNWTPFDHVGGSFKYTAVTIASDIPSNTPVNGFVRYWIPEYPDHFIHGGEINFSVGGKDLTAPIVERITLKSDNILRVHVRDGSEVREVTARLFFVEEESLELQFALEDSGEGVDRVSGDHIYTGLMEVPRFGKYTISLKMTDEWGNTRTQELEDEYIIYGQKFN